MAQAVGKDAWPDCQIAAFLMAVRLRGMNAPETLWLTQAMAKYSGRLGPLPWEKGKKGDKGFRKEIFVADKHSTGGVGDGVSLVLAPVAASLGLRVPMMSGRSLGLTGGTLDKLESIPGFQVRLPRNRLINQLNEIGVAMFGQGEGLAPVDRKFYALRDAIGAVDSEPLIVASILSKKLIEGLDGLVFDVKIGRGAIFANRSEATGLARALLRTARGCGLACRAVMTAMDEPLGRAIGNALEIRQAWEILDPGSTLAQSNWNSVRDYFDVTSELLYQMLFLAGRVRRRVDSREMIYQSLRSGRALAKFREMLVAQGVAPHVARDLPRFLPRSRRVVTVSAFKSGRVRFVDAGKMALVSLRLGVLRRRQEDAADPAGGIFLLKKSGETVRRGEALAEIHFGNAVNQDSKMAPEAAREAFEISPQKFRRRSVIGKVL